MSTNTSLDKDLTLIYRQYLNPIVLEETAAPNKPQELEHFKRQLQKNGECIQANPYSCNKNAVMTYKAIFFGLGCVFFILTAWIMLLSPTWHYHYLFGSGEVSKILISMLTGFLGLMAFKLGYIMKAEHEIASKIFKSAKTKVQNIFYRKQSNLSGGMSFFGNTYREISELKLTCQEAIEEMTHLKDEIYHLLQRIGSNRQKNIDKELLFNQALTHFRKSLDKIIERYTF